MPKIKQFLKDKISFPYCKGCGHTQINKAIDSALQKLDKDPKKINLISDIGCVGLVDKLFLTNTIHTLHGRSTAIATGLQLADEILFDNETVHIVMIGDGGSTIGNFIPPLQIMKILEYANAGFLSRKVAPDKDLDDEILKAIKYPGFAIVEIIELCTGYGTKWNSLTKKDLDKILEGMGSQENGILVELKDKTAFGKMYKKQFPKNNLTLKNDEIEVKQKAKGKPPFSVIVAGSAGEGVQFASKLLLAAGVASGLQVVQKNNNPVKNFFKTIPKTTLLILDDSLPKPETKAKIVIKPFCKEAKNKKLRNIVALGFFLKYTKAISVDSFEEAVRRVGKNVDGTVEALNIGWGL